MPPLIILADLSSDIGWIPKSWSGIIAIGAVVGFIVAWFATRDARKRIATANAATLAAVERQLTAITAEKDDYRQKLHDQRDANQALVLRIKELELRPDISALFTASQEFYQQQTKVQAAQAELMSETIAAVHKHDSDVTVRMQPIYDGLKSMGDGIAELLKRSAPLTA